MGDSPKKLFTWKTWLIIAPALVAGSAWEPFKEYRANGTIQTLTLVISVIVFCLGIGIAAAIHWYANRPETNDKSGHRS